MYRYLMTLAAISLLMQAGLTVAPAQAQGKWEATVLPMDPARVRARAGGIEGTGPYVGSHVDQSLGDAPATWELTMLPMDPAWAGARANDVNDTELIGGSRQDEFGAYYPAFWQEGQPYGVLETCGTPEGWDGANGAVIRVNNDWMAAGHLWIEWWQNAMVWDLETCGVENIHPEGMWASGTVGFNEPGDVVGFVIQPRPEPIPPGMPPWRSMGYFWSHNRRADRLLDPGELQESWAYGVNSRGTVAGISFDRNQSYHATVWTRQGRLDLHPDLVAADPRTVHSFAWDVHENGTVVGHSIVEFLEPCTIAFPACYLETRAWAWNEATGVVFLDSGEYVHANPWETAGQYIAGTLGDCANEGDWQAAVWVKGELEIIPDPVGLPISEAYGVNRSGVVSGYSFDDCGLAFSDPWIAARVAP